MSSSEQTLDLHIDTSNDVYDKEEIIKNNEFEYLDELATEEIELNERELKDCLTEELKVSALENKRRFIQNSEIGYECWYIENPKTKF